MMWNLGTGWGWWMVFGWIWMIVFWGLIIWGIYTLVARLSEPRPVRYEPQPSAMEILERRYASGELSHEQFEEMRQHLTADRSSNGTPSATGANTSNRS